MNIWWGNATLAYVGMSTFLDEERSTPSRLLGIIGFDIAVGSMLSTRSVTQKTTSKLGRIVAARAATAAKAIVKSPYTIGAALGLVAGNVLMTTMSYGGSPRAPTAEGSAAARNLFNQGVWEFASIPYDIITSGESRYLNTLAEGFDIPSLPLPRHNPFGPSA